MCMRTCILSHKPHVVAVIPSKSKPLPFTAVSTTQPIMLKELRHDSLSHFFDGLNRGSRVEKPENNGLLRKNKQHQRVDSKAKRNKDG